MLRYSQRKVRTLGPSIARARFNQNLPAAWPLVMFKLGPKKWMIRMGPKIGVFKPGLESRMPRTMRNA